MTDACAKCGAPLPKVSHGPPRRLCSKCRTATLLGVAADEIGEVASQSHGNEPRTVAAASRAKPRAPMPPPPPPAPVVESSQDQESPAGAPEEAPERPSVMADLLAMSAAAPAPEQRRIDDDLLDLPSAPFQNGSPVPAAAVDTAPVSSVATAEPALAEGTAAGAVDHARAATDVLGAGAERCPVCGGALPASPRDAPPKPAATPIERVRALLRRREVRTFGPWVVAGAWMLVAIVALLRGGGSGPPPAAAPTPSGDVEAQSQASADATGARPAPAPKLAPRPKATSASPLKPAGAKTPLGAPSGGGAQKPAPTH